MANINNVKNPIGLGVVANVATSLPCYALPISKYTTADHLLRSLYHMVVMHNKHTLSDSLKKIEIPAKQCLIVIDHSGDHYVCLHGENVVLLHRNNCKFIDEVE